MPHPAVLPVKHPMILIREVQEFTWYTPLLQNVEEHDAFGLWQAVIQAVVHNELRSRPVENVVDGIPALVVFAVVPECAIEL